MNNKLNKKMESLQWKIEEQEKILANSIDSLRTMLNGVSDVAICLNLESHVNYINNDFQKLRNLHLQLETLQDIL